MNTNNIEAVDLGLSVKWAKWNIGATSEDEYGSYIAWGDPTGENQSYVSDEYPNDCSDIAGTKYDTATALWGEGWKMPTPAEWKELDGLTKELVTLDNGVKVFKVTASNGNYIYLPRGGYKTSSGLQEQNVTADYWTSENTAQSWAVGVSIGKVSSTFESEDLKGWHMLIRPVYKSSDEDSDDDNTGAELTEEGKKAVAVDLGLSVKWATYNVGATADVEQGSCFSWGSTIAETCFTKDNYKWYDGNTGKYNIPNTTISYTENDAAYKLWGGTWRMPTEDEMNELVSKCKWIENGNGFIINGPNGNTIFLPYTGFYIGDRLTSDTKCYYWSGSYNQLPLHAEDYWAYYLTNYTSNSEVTPTVMSTYVYNGMYIRPVQGGSLTPEVPDTPDTPVTPDTPDEPDTPSEDKEAIDLGLSVKWANQNIKSTSDSSKDAFFSWGSIKEQASYTEDNYAYLHKDISDNGTLPSDKDAALQNWGDKWRMPTINEWNELITKCEWVQATKNGVTGYNVTGNGNTIFIPLSGQYNGDELNYANHQALYWTSECKTNDTNNFTDAYGAFITVDSQPYYFVSGSNNRYLGSLIRPVYDENLTPSTPDNPNTPSDPSTDESFDGKSRQELINEYSIAFKSNHYKKYVVDFSKPWDLFKTKSEGEFMSHIDDTSFFEENADFENTHFDGVFSINHWKGDTEYMWSDYLKALFLNFADGAGFKANADTANGNFLSAVDFGTKYSQVDLRKEKVGNIGMGSGIFSTQKTLWVAGTYAQPGVNFYYRDPSFFDFKGLNKVTLYGFNLDEVPCPGSDADYGRYDYIQAKGYKEAMFNFMRPYTLSLFADTPNEEVNYAIIQDKTFRNGVVSISFSRNPTYQSDNKLTAQMNIPYDDNMYFKAAGANAYSALVPIDGMFTISVEEGYEIKSIIFENGSGGFALFVDGKTLYYNTEDSAGNTSLPIYTIDQDGVVWIGNKKGLTSVDFVQNGSYLTRDLYAVYVGYVKVGETITPPTPFTPDSSEGTTDSKGNTSDKSDEPDVPSGDDGTPVVSKKALTFTDTNESGYSVESNVILYAGGQEVIPQTMAQKDNTLFLGNYKESSKVFDQSTLDFIKNNSEVEYEYGSSIPKGEIGGLYMYENQLTKSSYDIASFKGGEAYRFGLVFQDRRGEWSEAVYVGDFINDIYPKDEGTSFKAPKAHITLSSSAVTKLYKMGYRKAKAVVVYPTINNRLVACQGVMCPTVYNINQRKSNAPYAASSWFFREMHSDDYVRTSVQNKHGFNIYTDINDYIEGNTHTTGSNGTNRRVWNSDHDYFVEWGIHSIHKDKAVEQFTAEISCASILNRYCYVSNNAEDMFVDWNTVTMNTPEVDFSLENSASTIPTENLKLRIIGLIPLTSNANDIYVNTSTPPIKTSGFTGLYNTNNNHNNISYKGSELRLTKFDWYDYHYRQDIGFIRHFE